MTVTMEHQSPARDGWTTDDLDALPDTERRPELLDGVLLVPPSPTHLHQSIALRLGALLDASCPTDFEVSQGVEVRLSPRRSFIPDLLLVTAVAADRNTHWFVPHEVILAIEIVSATSVSLDRITKPALYAEAGIAHYWRVETDPELIVHTHTIDPLAKVYRETGRCTSVIDVNEPWPMKIAIDDLRRRN
ncbi:Uma2 family endonuclease [Luedemannella helvata]|uniref:Uma2 family endonuclease n=1 Tax=Luedemannella helvata TaxID=349315 RepID=A0ABP4WWZ0_9ACTN